MSGLGMAIASYADTVYAVPGYPVTTIIEETCAELCINEKVALEYALGDSLSGKRSCVIVKHVGMNVLADTLVHATAQGLISGVVIVVGDDPTAYGTQTIQDSRIYGSIAMCPVLDMERPDPVGEAFLASETFSRIALLRYVPDDLNKTWPLSPGEKERKKGVLADPDLTMYGRGILAYASVPGMVKAGYVPFPISPVVEGNYPKSRSERRSSRVFCNDCPFKMVFDLLQEREIRVISDTGCSLLSMFPPYSFGIANYGMGSSLGVAARSTGVALMGDYALLHSGVQALIDLYAKGLPLLCIVLQNRCMGTTGRQPVPDILNYIGFTSPVVCKENEYEEISGLLVPVTSLKVLVIQGACPEEKC